MRVYRGKLSLIYKENSHIFNLPLRFILFALYEEGVIGQHKKFAVCLTMEEGILHKNKLGSTYLLGGVNAFIF